MNKYNPYFSLFRYISLKFQKKIKSTDGHKAVSEDGYVFLTVDLSNDSVPSGSKLLKVSFKNHRLSHKAFIRISKMTIPFFAGLPGFMNKKFIENESENEFTGIYEWSSKIAVESYVASYAMKMMKWWSKPFKVRYEVINGAER